MISDPDNEMGNLIRGAFRKSGLSILALAKQSGVPYATVHAVMAGTRDPLLSSVAKMSKVLGLALRPVGRGKRKGR